MKKLSCLVFTIVIACCLHSQNVGIGATKPLHKLQVNGSLLVNEPMITSVNPPSKQYTMVNNSTTNFSFVDSTGRIYDPGGPAGNYLANLTSYALIPTGATAAIATELIIESIDLGTFDSLIVRSGTSLSDDLLLAVGNGYSTPGSYIFNSDELYIIFKSNGDVSTGAGMSLLFKRIYRDNTYTVDTKSFAGYSMLFDVKSASFRTGRLTNTQFGNGSVAMGIATSASGTSGFAAGTFSEATGNYSTAMGINAKAMGTASVSLGNANDAIGNSSVAVGSNSETLDAYAFAAGYLNVASGLASIAMGRNSRSKGYYSAAIGYGTQSNAFGSLAIGQFNDTIVSTETSAQSTSPLFIIGNGSALNVRSNVMVVRRDGRIGMGTNTPGADLHIRHGSGGGLIIENESNNNSWRLYSAAGDANLTFYNDANVEIADIDNGTGAFSALSDHRYKKDIETIPSVLKSVMQLRPSLYHFNWQQATDPLEVGMLAQETRSLFPSLVSYDREKDIYKMNYAGFSTIAIKAIQEQQQIIGQQQETIQQLIKRIESLEARIK